VYLLNTMTCERPLYNLTALTLHECGAGACVSDVARHGAQESARSFASNTTSQRTGRGGRCIASSLGLEMNMYETPYDRFGMLGLPDLASGAARR